jgi:hypothetical protein
MSTTTEKTYMLTGNKYFWQSLVFASGGNPNDLNEFLAYKCERARLASGEKVASAEFTESNILLLSFALNEKISSTTEQIAELQEELQSFSRANIKLFSQYREILFGKLPGQGGDITALLGATEAK